MIWMSLTLHLDTSYDILLWLKIDFSFNFVYINFQFTLRNVDVNDHERHFTHWTCRIPKSVKISNRRDINYTDTVLMLSKTSKAWPIQTHTKTTSFYIHKTISLFQPIRTLYTIHFLYIVFWLDIFCGIKLAFINFMTASGVHAASNFWVRFWY